MIYQFRSARSALHLQHLDGFGKNQFAIEALGSEEADLTVTGVQLIQALEGDALTVTDPVIGEVTEDDACIRALLTAEVC